MAKGIRYLCLASCLTGVASLCSAGVLSGKTCCAKSCGKCGGSGCDSSKGGSKNCCIGTITNSKKTCQKASDTACTIPPSPAPPPPSPPPSGLRLCVQGLKGRDGLGDDVCCPRSCNQGRRCSRGWLCQNAGPDNQCCINKIRSSKKICQKEGDTACILQKFATVGAVTLPERGLSMWSSVIAAGVALLFTSAGVLRWQRTRATAATCDSTKEQTAEQTPPLLE